MGIQTHIFSSLTSVRPTLPKTEPRLPTIPILTQSPVRAERSPSPARNTESVNIHVKNLVRPFTLNQLKELLGKSGTLVDDGFWIDKIKSHCYAVVSTSCRKLQGLLKVSVCAMQMPMIQYHDLCFRQLQYSVLCITFLEESY